MTEPFLHAGEFAQWGIPAHEFNDSDDQPEDPHAGCCQPHTDPDGYTDCDGQPL